MARSDREYSLQMQGMAKALEIVKKQGVEGLEKEVALRNATFIPMYTNKKEIEEMRQGMIVNILQTTLTMVFATLNDEFNFGESRLKKFKKAFKNKIEVITVLDPYGDHFAKTSEYAEMLNEKYNLEIDTDVLAKIEKENDRKEKKNAKNNKKNNRHQHK